MSINLIRQDHKHPDLKDLCRMKRALEDFLRQSPAPNDPTWHETIMEIVQFQYEDGSFNLLDSYNIESDCRVEFCHEPTYICTAILMKALLADEGILTGKEDVIMGRAMKMCCARRLQGHGFDDLKGCVDAMKYFILGDAKKFLQKYPDICREFTDLFFDVGKSFPVRVKKSAFTGDWGENFETSIRAIAEVFDETDIFVYGTLMTGRANHNAFLGENKCLGTGILDGFEMYALGSFPGIIPGKGKVSGEVYRVSGEQLKELDRFESEGSLYVRKSVTVCLNGEETITAAAYVYNGDVRGRKKLEGRFGCEDVWYVSYGSNLLEERLMCYISGGNCPYNGKHYSACNNKTSPKESRPVDIPYDMYYSNYNLGSWKNSAVCFLDVSKPGHAFGRAWKIKRSQLRELHRQEGKGENWYPDCIRLDDIDGLPAFTFAGGVPKEKEPFSRVSSEYGIVLYKGMKETYPKMFDNEIIDYLRKCGR